MKKQVWTISELETEIVALSDDLKNIESAMDSFQASPPPFPYRAGPYADYSMAELGMEFNQHDRVLTRTKRKLCNTISFARMEAKRDAIAYPHNRSIDTFRHYQAKDIDELNEALDDLHWKTRCCYGVIRFPVPLTDSAKIARQYDRRALSDAQESIRFCELIRAEKLESLYQAALKESEL
ncbi:hypothetical protein LCGC14_2107100 [marine sediment metagenome]|uniref:Uncharacterized protein n=1 Tax=marine sediment metagenome TaxID=412755 RepID=A0A0F9EVF7_9ZZZZ